MKGDVKSAYKNLHVHEDVSAYFAGSLPEEDVVVIDLALPFGWTGSAAHYGVFGKAISHLVRRESPNTLDPSDPDATKFFCFDWVDDHVLVEYDTGNRLQACDSALRLAMTAVLGPRAINNKKFTEWSTNVVALGLEWDSVAMTVSMPVHKLHKALGRIQAALDSQQTTRTALSKLLGSLRHVCSCIRPAKPFFQRLVALWKRSPRARPIEISQEARLDLVWFAHILRYGRLCGVPLEYFCGLPAPSVHLYMDASDSGLCVLNPVRHEYIRLQFDAAEHELIKQRQLSINVREQFSALLAVLCWGKYWGTAGSNAMIHVRFWIDNTAAVTWCNKLTSTNPLSQEMNRILGAVEAEWSIRVSAEHLAGSSNFLADLGSRHRAPEHEEGLRRQLVTLQERSLADTSRRQYDASWKQWVSFSRRIGRSPWLPEQDRAAQSLQLVFFAIDRWSSTCSNGRVGSSTSVHAQVSHVKWHHKVYAGFEPAISPSHATAFAGMRRISPPPRPRTPVSWTMLEWMAAQIDYKQPNQRLFLGAALLGFLYLLRSSEYLATKGGRHRYALEVRDVEILDITGSPAVNFNEATQAVITLRGSKTDQQGQGVSRCLTRSGHNRVCPVMGASLLLELAQRHNLCQTDPICSFSRSRMLKAEELSKALKAAATGTGLDPSRISCHSLRSGGASALIAGGADSTTIKLHGRWKSSTFQRYTHYSQELGAPLAPMMAGKGDLASRVTSTTRRNGVHAYGVPTRGTS